MKGLREERFRGVGIEGSGEGGTGDWRQVLQTAVKRDQ